ncbi:UBX domain-containing protein 7 [Cephus cinctus]|uniref:UBX domain-containing protein 7 n=1 Tax=Cephus cinctus TaxID=211228 RepID=A0AAJ7BU34_CEPCN|nr:UBX domain-containing protein 7 [Cephus cinctus]XP_015594381.1 UBX domain-containing protein 7 [Cephus cinctus]XP_015594382.1 UBX domain-containing protein 7 [Cephus cinctus]
MLQDHCLNMDQHLIEQFVQVTGQSEATAAQYLAVAEGNVENAITLMFEGGIAVADEEEQVRAPIPPTRQVLVPSGHICPSAHSASNNVFDRFRDFAVETQRQEEELTRRVAGMKKMSPRKSKRLEDLFRPPCDILFLGTFSEARERAKIINRWLLVNVQNPQEFACQILNRDLWPNEQIRGIVNDHFVLWQIQSNTVDGKRYIDFYNVSKYPYLAIIDPRTGECMRAYNNISVDTLAAELNDMLSIHPSPSSSDTTANPQDLLKTAASPSSNDFRNGRIKSSSKRRSLMNLIEPINNPDRCEEPDNTNEKTDRRSAATNSIDSVASSSNYNTLSDSQFDMPRKRSKMESSERINEKADLATTVPNEQKSIVRNHEIEATSSGKLQLQETNCDKPSLRLCLRLPNGGKEAISMYGNDTIAIFMKRMEDIGYPATEYIYLIPFPKTNVNTLPLDMQLSDTVLYPSNTIFITKI